MVSIFKLVVIVKIKQQCVRRFEIASIAIPSCYTFELPSMIEPPYVETGKCFKCMHTDAMLILCALA